MILALHRHPAAGCRTRCSASSGQALVEALVAMFVLAVLWVGLNWLAHYQDMALSAAHASRHAAFIATRTDPEAVNPVADVPVSGQPRLAQWRTGPLAAVKHYFTGSAHRWNDRRGVALLEPESGVQASWQRLQPLSAIGQPGGAAADASALRREWSLEDAGILQTSITLAFGGSQDAPTHADGPLKLGVFDIPYPELRRLSHILVGAGHAASDIDTQQRVAASGLAWASAADNSLAAGATVASRAHGVDAPWNRHTPTFDWLRPWSGLVPGHLVQDYARSPHAPDRLPE